MRLVAPPPWAVAPVTLDGPTTALAPSPLFVALPIALLILLAGTSFGSRLLPARRPPASAARSTSRTRRPPRAIVTQIGRTIARRVAVAGRRRRPPDDAAVAEWCSALARRVRSGDTLAAALRSAATPGDLGPAVEPLLLALDRGASVARATEAVRHRSAALDVAVTVITACASLGGPAAEPLDRAAATLRRRVADTAERRAHSAQARLSALVLTVLPGGFLAVLAITSASVRGAAVTTVGLTSVALGAMLNLAGWAWMRRTIGAIT